MKKNNELKNKITRKVHRVGVKLKKHSPAILMGVGTVGVVASTVMACKATLKVDDILAEAKENIDKINEVAADPAMAEKYPESDKKKDLTIVKVQTGVKLVKLYAPAAAVGVASLGCMMASHKILTKRNIALAAAYAATHDDFKEYRGRVIERFGKEMDRELKYNIKKEEIENTVVNEDGTEQVAKEVVDVAHVDPNRYSLYSIVFDDGNLGWSKNPEDSKYFLIQQQNYANEKLKSRGYLTLNDVYEMLGAPKTKAGFTVGWVYDEKNPVGDNFVDFGLFDIHNAKARDFINGREKVIILDFNVDGDISRYF